MAAHILHHSNTTPPAQRLRASCDACSSSKVKCDKEQPSCRRCVANGTACVYGISRKHGKQAHRKQSTAERGGSHEQLSTSRHPSTSPGFDLQFFNPELPLSFDDLIQDLDLPPVRTGHDRNIDGLLPPDGPLAEDDQSLRTSHPVAAPTDTENANPSRGFGVDSFNFDGVTDPIEDLASGSDFSLLDQNDILPTPIITPPHQPPDLPPHLHYDALISKTRPSLHAGPNKPRHESHPCYRLACSALVALNLEDKFSCAAHTSGRSTVPPLTWDQVLRANKTALTTLQQIIGCPCSAKDPHIIFLCSSIISKVLFWYQVANRIIKSATLQHTAASPSVSTSLTPPGLSPDSASTGTPPALPHGTHGSAASLPISIGAFSVDVEDRAALGQHLLLSELRKTARLVERLQARQADSEDEGSESGASGGTESSSALHGMLGHWLKDELSKTIREVKGQISTPI
ncbi:MAG: hypothetical protein M1822_000721 [Bathelium mastoideum]|nr:MAG: hypothetical protein M1822_000721 [Bathelium mastoideum]